VGGGMTTDDLLKALCGSDRRQLCQNPWTITADGIIYSAATDGMRLLLISDARSPYPPVPDASVFANIFPCRATDSAADYELRRSDLLAEIGEGAPVDWGAQCHRCHGEGSKACDLGHEHNCEACEGRGSINGVNSYSWLRAVPLSITAGDRSAIIDMQLLRGVIAPLPGDPIRVGIGSHRQCFFSSLGWVLVVAAMKPADYKPNIRSIQARPVQAPGC